MRFDRRFVSEATWDFVGCELRTVLSFPPVRVRADSAAVVGAGPPRRRPGVGLGFSGQAKAKPTATPGASIVMQSQSD